MPSETPSPQGESLPTKPLASSEAFGRKSGPLEADWIGPFKLLEVLGEGGFGTVYLAERREPMVQRVAIKIIKPGMDSKAVIARFEQERQALAVMDHPNVAKVLDGGVTPTGRPYFVMEYVKGEPITAFCDRNRLTIAQRLELFIPVCEAVQHAHLKGIIHRDIKPSNIMISMGDGNGSSAGVHVKVIDFGVAKAISHTLTDKTIFTEHGQIIGTPEYMSPEQAEMGATDIDTRTDVYSLGVVLYELLSGALPFDSHSLRSAGYAEIQRIIREVDPPRPSTRLSTLDDQTAAAIAKARQESREAIAKNLRRELEWIPLKAMRKDRRERYTTPTDLADDVRRYIKGEPLEAGPESAAYRLRKYVRRYRGEVLAGAAVALSLVIGLGVAIVQRNEARSQRAEAVRQRGVADAKTKEAEREREAVTKAKETIEYNSYVSNTLLAEEALFNQNFARLRSHVEGCPPRLRGWEWRFLYAAADSSLGVVSGAAVALAGDGRSVVERVESGFRWRRIAPSELASMLDPASDSNRYRFSEWQQSHDGATAAAEDDAIDPRGIVAWDCPSGRVVREVAFDLPKRPEVPDPHLSPSWGLSPDGEWLAVAGPTGVVRVLHLRDPSRDRELVGHASRVQGLAWSPGSTRLLSVASENTAEVRLWDIERSECTKTVPLVFFASIGPSAKFNADGSQFLVGNFGLPSSIRIFDTGSGEQTGELQLPASLGVNGAWFPGSDGNIVVNTIKSPYLIALDAGDAARRLNYRGQYRPVVALARASQGFLAAGDDLSIKAWDLQSPTPLAEYVGCRQRVTCIAGIEGSRLFATLEQPGEVRLWHLPTRLIVGAVRISARARAAAFWGDGSAIRCTHADGKVSLLDVCTGSFIEQRDMLGRFGSGDTLDRSGAWLAQKSGNRLVVWDCNAGGQRAVIDPRDGANILRYSFSPSGAQLVGISLEGDARIWDVATGVELSVREREEDAAVQPRIVAAEFTDAGSRLLTLSTTGRISSWASSTGQIQYTIDVDGAFQEFAGSWVGLPQHLAVSADGSRAAVTYSGCFCLVDLAGGGEPVWVSSVGDSIAEVVFAPNMGRLATADRSGGIRLWDTTTGTMVLEAPGAGESSRQIEFSPDGTRLMTLGLSGSVTIFDSIPYRIRFAERQLREHGDMTNLGILYLKELRGESPPTWLSNPTLSEHRPDFTK